MLLRGRISRADAPEPWSPLAPPEAGERVPPDDKLGYCLILVLIPDGRFVTKSPVAGEVSGAVQRVGGCDSKGLATSPVLPFAHVVQYDVSPCPGQARLEGNSERGVVEEKSELQRNSERVIEEIRHRCQARVLQMRCPQHQKNARVMVEGNRFDDVTFEVFTCCEPFRTHVYDELMEELYQTDAIGSTRHHDSNDFAL